MNHPLPSPKVPKTTDSERLSLRQPNAYFATLSPPFVCPRVAISSFVKGGSFVLLFLKSKRDGIKFG